MQNIVKKLAMGYDQCNKLCKINMTNPNSCSGEYKGGQEDENLRLYYAIRRIPDILFSDPEVTTDPLDIWSGKMWIEDRRDTEPMHSSRQTSKGIFLVMSYGRVPSEIYTPWGIYNFAGSSSGGSESTVRLFSHLELTKVSPRQITDAGEFGPIYAVTRVDDISLPEPEMRKSSDLPYEKTKREWDELREKWKASRVA